MAARVQTIAPSDLPAPLSRWRRRYTVTLLFFFATVICYVDRVNISIAIIPMARDQGYSEAIQGLILSSFFWGYVFSHFGGGWMADRFGGKWVLGAGVACWSLATFLTPVAAARSLSMLLGTRVLLGLGEGVNFPAMHSLAARWIPLSERARVLTFSYSGLLIGTVAALLAAPPLIIRLGWPAIFYLSGLLGALWLVFWTLKSADGPEQSGAEHFLTAGARDARLASRAPAVPFKLILREPAVWALIITHVCNNWGFYITLLWLPSYLHLALKVPLKNIGAFSLIPWVVSFLVGNASGWLADEMIRRGVSVTVTRKSLQSLAFLLGAIPLFLAPHTTDLLATVALFSISAMCSGIALAAFGLNHLDIGPQYAGVLMGMTNTAGTIPGIIGVAATGVIVQATGSFATVFYLTGAIYLIGMVAFLLWGSGERKF